MRLTLPGRLRTRPKVSVVVPCYNYGHFLPHAVQSALDQPGVDLEIIIVDDASTDGSELVAREIAARHDSVQLVENPTNIRHIATYNRGLSLSTGDYVVLLSADDLLAPGALSRSTALMEAHPDVALVYGFAPSFETEPPPPKRARTWSLWGGEEWLERVCRRADNLIVNPEAIVRRSVVERFGGYDSSFPHAADMLLWLQAATVGDVGRVNGVQAFYREHGTNMHRTDFAGTLTDMREREALFTSFLGPDGAGGSLPEAGVLVGSARRSLARESLRCALLAADSQDDVGGSDTEAFADFATRVSPDVRRSRLWSALQARADGPVSRVRGRANQAAYSLRWKVRWRLWRQWGL